MKKIIFAVIVLLIGGMIMSYTRVNWQNAPSTATPVNAENLNKMDKGIADAHSQLAETAKVEYFSDVPNISQLAEGKIGVVLKDKVSLKVVETYPKTLSADVDTTSPIFIKLNLPVNKSTINESYVRIYKTADGVASQVVAQRDYNANANTIVIIPSALDINTNYSVEITDGVTSTNGFTIGTNSIFRFTFTTGEHKALTLNDPMNAYNTNWTETIGGNAIVTQESGYVKVVNGTGNVSLTALSGSVGVPYGVDIVLRVDSVATLGNFAQIRLETVGNSFIVGLSRLANGDIQVYDVRESNVISKQIITQVGELLHIRISSPSSGEANAWINGSILPGLKSAYVTGSRIMLMTISGKNPVISIYDVKAYDAYGGWDVW